MPFIGVMRCTLNTEDEALLGPARPANGPHPTPWTMMFRSAWALLLGLLLRRHRPNVFFDEKGLPVAAPELVS